MTVVNSRGPSRAAATGKTRHNQVRPRDTSCTNPKSAPVASTTEPYDPGDSNRHRGHHLLALVRQGRAVPLFTYEDAVRQLRAWKQRGLKLCVFSSGSILAQKLLFGHTAWGDLTPLFSDYFDTTIGNKRDPAAYHAIAGKIGLPPVDILFLSDIREELDAARAAGMRTIQVLREGVTPATDHPQARCFDDIAVTP